MVKIPNISFKADFTLKSCLWVPSYFKTTFKDPGKIGNKFEA